LQIDLHNGDCLELMKDIPDGSVDLVLTDPPYGTTACKWDSVIPFEPMWEQYNRIIKPNGAIALFGAQPFTAVLVASNIKNYKHHWIWMKNRGTGFQVAKYRPMMQTEDIVVFCKRGNTLNYNPQMIPLDKPYKGTGAKRTNGSNPIAHFNKIEKEYTHKYPTNVINCAKVSKPQHPTQKPVALLEYLIRTYSNEGETVLDNCMGSGSTGVACVNTNRNFIGIELDEGYFKIAQERIEAAQAAK
jgi:site-specific DNA-methyltransferase (adenine-specific)